MARIENGQFLLKLENHQLECEEEEQEQDGSCLYRDQTRQGSVRVSEDTQPQHATCMLEGGEWSNASVSIDLQPPPPPPTPPAET